MLEEQVFDARRHDRSGFQCGAPALDDYLRKYAVQQSAKGISSVFVLVDDIQPSKILGFYTLSAAQIGSEQLSKAERKNCRVIRFPAFAWAAWRAAWKAVAAVSAQPSWVLRLTDV